MLELLIRPIEQSESATWEILFQGYADFYKVPLTEQARSTTWEWIFDPDNNFWCDVAVNSDGEIVGFTQYQLMHRSLSGGMVCYLSDLYALPQSRGSGIGRKLIDHVFEFARSKNINNVRWLTQDYNYPARLLYDTYGRKSDFVLYSFPVE
ncbi:MAG: GNAT superfamily N-acetyltransferase [Parasphingorhabdus sp.]|jgi:GNAT superfamily N-acetyltransferase